jgi:AICAR transformylase/IMP cyclohydrolase PurH
MLHENLQTNLNTDHFRNKITSKKFHRTAKYELNIHSFIGM